MRRLFGFEWANPFLDVVDEGGGSFAGEEETESAELSEPDVEDEDEGTGEEETEPAEPLGKSDADAAFARMRRENEQLQRDNAKFEEALRYFFDGEDPDEMLVQAQATAENREEDDVREEREAADEYERLAQENEELNERVLDYEARHRMDEDLREIQKIDPNVKSLDELGQTYLDYISQGLSGKQAYYAAKAQEAMEKTVPPKAPGKVNQNAEPQDFYTKEQVAAMSQKEVHDNYDVIRKSMAKWN